MPATTRMLSDAVALCLGVIVRGVTPKVFVAAPMATHVRGPAEGPIQDQTHDTAENLALRALALYNVSLLSARQGRSVYAIRP